MRKKLSFVLYIALIVILTLAFVILAVNLFITERNEYVNNAKYQAEAICRAYDNELNSYLDMSLNISTNPLIVELLQFDGNDVQEAFDGIIFLKKYFSSFNEIENYMPDQLCIYLSSGFYMDNAYIKDISELREKNVWKKLSEGENKQFVWEYNASRSGREYLSLYSQILKSTDVLGYLEIKIPYEKLIYNLENASIGENDGAALISLDGRVVYEGGDNATGKKIVMRALNGDTIIVYANIRKAMSGVWNIAAWLMLIYIFFLIAIKYISKMIVTKVTKKLDDFIHIIRSDDDLLFDSELIVIDGDDDIAQIKRKFKELIIRNNKLHEAVEKANLDKQYAEFNFLQYSINPHLLYNTLSCIKWCTVEKSDDEICDIIDDLSSYYRMVLSGGESLITIFSELSLVERYVSLMGTVYGTKIKLETDVPDELGKTYIIKLLLQPIVENSILHGLNGVKDAKVSISVRSLDCDRIEIRICDNGYGMDQETADNLLNVKKERRQGGYGVSNVIERIKCYYGNESELTVNSKINEGTEVTISIRKITDIPNGSKKEF